MDCVKDLISQKYECDVPWFETPGFPTCNKSRLINMLSYTVNVILSDYTKNCSCVQPCRIASYYIPDSYDNYPSNSENKMVTKVRIRMISNMVEHVEETFAYDTCHLISDVGGSIGFLLGMSVLAFFQLMAEVLQKTFNHIKIVYKRYQRRTY